MNEPDHEYINPNYVHPTVIKTLQQQFAQQDSIQLRNFLNKECYDELAKPLSTASWKPRAVFDIYAHYTSTIKDVTAFLTSKQFLNLCSAITGLTLKHATFNTFLFKHRNYTLLNDELREPPGIAFELDFTADWQKEWGGYTSIVNGENELFRITPTPNTLTLYKRDRTIQSFVKYVNHLAGKDMRIVVRGTLS